MIPWILLTTAALVATLIAERRHLDRWAWLFKPAASIGFIGAALAAGAAESVYGTSILIALTWCLLGDVLLIPRGTSPTFLFGVVAFLIGHVGFAVSFHVRGVDGAWLAASAGALLIPAAFTLRWLRTHVTGGMWPAIVAYIAVITVMVAMAFGAAAQARFDRAGLLVLSGALCFWLSDLCVARQRFVTAHPANRYVGLPLYYTAQLLLAASVGWPPGATP